MELVLVELQICSSNVNAITSSQYRLWKQACICREKDVSKAVSANCVVTRSFEKKILNQGCRNRENRKNPHDCQQEPLAASPTPIWRTSKGIATVVSAPGSMEMAMEDSIARLSRCLVFRVDRGTIMA